MKRRGAKHRVAAAAAVALLATACGGGESSGLATLVGTDTSAPAVVPEDVEPVSEPTGVSQPSPETAVEAETVEPVPSAEADQIAVEADETSTSAATAESGEVGDEDDVESEDMAGDEPTEPESLIDEEFAEPEDLSDEERLLAFAECMRENGVDFPDPVVEADGTVTFGFRPGGGGGGLGRLREIGQDSDLPAARDACSGMLEGLAFGPGQGGFDLIELQDTLLAFAQCMRDNGVDMGDPDLSGFGPGANDDQPSGPFGPSVAIDIDDPDFAAAFAVCQQQLPQAGGGPRLGGGG